MDTAGNLYIVDADRIRRVSGGVITTVAGNGITGSGMFSPDGRWVAYESDDSGRYEIYVAPFPGQGGKRQISIGGGVEPRWREDGKEIFYVGPNGTLVATEVSTKGATVEVGVVHQLAIPVVTSAFYLYDVSADGQRFLVAAPREQAPTPLTLIENWSVQLRK